MDVAVARLTAAPVPAVLIPCRETVGPAVRAEVPVRATRRHGPTDAGGGTAPVRPPPRVVAPALHRASAVPDPGAALAVPAIGGRWTRTC